MSGDGRLRWRRTEQGRTEEKEGLREVKVDGQNTWAVQDKKEMGIAKLGIGKERLGKRGGGIGGREGRGKKERRRCLVMVVSSFQA